MPTVRMFGAQPARKGGRTPLRPIATNALLIIQYESASTIPRPIPYIVPRRPVLTPNGTASSVMTTVTNGNAILR